MTPAEHNTQYLVLAHVVNHGRTASFGLTVEELRKKLELRSRASVQHHINALIEKGLLSNIPGARRSLRATSKGKAYVELMESEGG
jgi:SOS-response transcriptional repressor LexA